MPFDSASHDASEERALQAAMEEARGDDLPAAKLRQMRDVLLRRRSMLADDFERESDADMRKTLEGKIAEVDEHIAILHEEAALTGFVEDAVKFSMEMRRLNEGYSENEN